MKQLKFPTNYYTEVGGSYTYVIASDSVIGSLELLWGSINSSPLKDLTKKDHKINKRLKNKIRAITVWKDSDKDSRVCADKEPILLLEEDEYDLLKRHLDANIFSSRASEDVVRLWDIIDEAVEFTLTSDSIK